jgi:hypothetical protein
MSLSIIKLPGSVTTVSNLDLREVCCEDGRWIEVVQDHVQWRALVFAVVRLRVLLPHC